MTIRSIAAVFVLTLIAGAPAHAFSGQVAGAEQETQALHLRDGSVLYGAVERMGDDEIVFRTIGGAEIRVARREAVSLRRARGEVVKGEFRPSDPNATRLLFAPTGRSLGRGEGYVGVYQIFMPFVQVGLTDRLSIGGGTPLIFGIDEGDRPFWVTPKVQILDRPRTKVAAGVLHIANAGDGSVGIAYAVVTTGSADAAATIGVGAGYETYDRAGATAIIMVGGERRLRRGLKVVTENYVWRGGDGIVSGAIRFYGERLSADLGLFVPIGADDLIALPIVNFVWTF
jgi:hypothetical protein